MRYSIFIVYTLFLAIFHAALYFISGGLNPWQALVAIFPAGLSAKAAAILSLWAFFIYFTVKAIGYWMNPFKRLGLSFSLLRSMRL